jgi:PAS domain S-box-containing protein
MADRNRLISSLPFPSPPQMGGSFWTLRHREPLSSLCRRYGQSFAVVVIAVILRLWLGQYLDKSGFAIFLLGMLLAAWLGGVGPSLLSQTMLLFAEAYWFSPPRAEPAELSIRAIVNLTAFYGVGTIVALLSEARQAAQRREQEQRNEASRQREQLHATIACIGDGVLVTDAEGRVTLMNPVAESMTGWTLEESRGKPVRDLFAICDELAHENFDNPVQWVLRHGQVSRQMMRLMITPRNDRRLPVAYSAAPILDAARRVTGVVIIFSDETERRRTEQALRHADKNKDDFLAMLAHELRNPLAPICMGLELMKLSASNPTELEEVRSMMHRQSRHMVRLIDDLLDVSRITRGKLELKKCQIQLSDVIRNAVEATHTLFGESEHLLTVDMTPDDVVIYADQDRLTQVVSNLLNNAAKYTPRRGRIRLAVEKGDGEVAVIVSDNGRGIPGNMLSSIFEMFTQVHGDTECAHKGLGIGLTLVKRLVEMHGGTVQVDSEGPGLGSTFQIRLPMWMPNQLSQLSPKVSVASPAEVSQRRVLVVDDNEDALRTLSVLVDRLGNEVRRARNGVEALAVAQEWPPDVILLDLGMPQMNGYECARRIRQEPWGRSIVIIATTGWGHEESRRCTKEAGFDHHLVKPVGQDKLQEVFADMAPRRLRRHGSPRLTEITASAANGDEHRCRSWPVGPEQDGANRLVVLNAGERDAS